MTLQKKGDNLISSFQLFLFWSCIFYSLFFPLYIMMLVCFYFLPERHRDTLEVISRNLSTEGDVKWREKENVITRKSHLVLSAVFHLQGKAGSEIRCSESVASYTLQLLTLSFVFCFSNSYLFSMIQTRNSVERT